MCGRPGPQMMVIAGKIRGSKSMSYKTILVHLNDKRRAEKVAKETSTLAGVFLVRLD